MGQFAQRAVGNLTSVATTPAVEVSDLESAALWLTGTFVGTAFLQVSPDGTTWVDEGSSLTAPGRFVIPAYAKQVRGRCSAFTSGTLAFQVTGKDDDRSVK